MCFRLVSTFERCGHRDTIAHVQLCSKARACVPSCKCALGSNDVSDPVYTIRGYCVPCSLNHAVLHHDGHLHEAPGNVAIVYYMENSRKAKARVNITVSTENNDVHLVWKEAGGGTNSWGSGAGGWGDVAEGNLGDWAAAKEADPGDFGAAIDGWDHAAKAAVASPYKADEAADSDVTAGAGVGSWGDDGQKVGEQGSGSEACATWSEEVDSVPR